jgi:hypothetical protein
MFKVPKDKTNDEIVRTFDTLIEKIEATGSDTKDLFLSKFSAEDLAANKANYVNTISEDASYQYLAFLPEKSQEIANKGIKGSLEELESQKNTISDELKELKNQNKV